MMSRLPDLIKKKFFFFSELWPFENLGILKLSDISKTIWAKGLKFGQLIEDNL